MLQTEKSENSRRTLGETDSLSFLLSLKWLIRHDALGLMDDRYGISNYTQVKTTRSKKNTLYAYKSEHVGREREYSGSLQKNEHTRWRRKNGSPADPLSRRHRDCSSYNRAKSIFKWTVWRNASSARFDKKSFLRLEVMDFGSKFVYGLLTYACLENLGQRDLIPQRIHLYYWRWIFTILSDLLSQSGCHAGRIEKMKFSWDERRSCMWSHTKKKFLQSVLVRMRFLLFVSCLFDTFLCHLVFPSHRSLPSRCKFGYFHLGHAAPISFLPSFSLGILFSRHVILLNRQDEQAQIH